MIQQVTCLLLDALLEGFELLDHLAPSQLARRLLAANAVELSTESVAPFITRAAFLVERELLLDRILFQAAMDGMA